MNWIENEIKTLEKLINEKQDLIDNWNLELKEIRKTKDPSFIDFAKLINKHGSKKEHMVCINSYIKRISWLKSGTVKSEEEYRKTAIISMNNDFMFMNSMMID